MSLNSGTYQGTPSFGEPGEVPATPVAFVPIVVTFADTVANPAGAANDLGLTHGFTVDHVSI